MNAAVFLDRDNTLIENDGDLGDPEQVKLIQGAASAVASLRGLGYTIIVVTNQGGVARGKYTQDDVDRVHERINELMRRTSNTAIDRFYYCPFHPDGVVAKFKREHPWRKPAPGMLLEAARELKLDLSQSWMIGDQLRDVEAGRAAGVRTILLTPEARGRSPLDRPGAAGEGTADSGSVTPDFTARNLVEAVKIVAQQRKPGVSEELRATAIKPKAAAPAAGAGSMPTSSTRAGVPKDRPAPISLNQPVITTPARTAEPSSAAPEDGEHQAQAADAAPVSEQAALRQILHELRSQRSATAGSDEWSLPQIMAIVLQMVAAVCLLAGLLMGENAESFLRWIGTGILLQLAVIATLLFRK